MKIGVLTLSLRANYGGNLQAFALMTALRDMGHEVWFINRERHKVAPLMIPFVVTYRTMKQVLLRRKTGIRSGTLDQKEVATITLHAREFIGKHVQPQTREFLSSRALARGIGEYGLDAIVVGSDQVWRRNYIAKNFTDFFLGFLPQGDTRTRRIAYAASFGTEDWLFTPVETQICAELAQRFSAIAVREDSGVGLCKQYLGVEAEHVIDPTLLLDADRYLNLLPETVDTAAGKRGGILVYVLDEAQEKRKAIESIAQALGKSVFRVNKNTDDRTQPLQARIAPPVEDWLRGFRDADFVVTDSFHGTVFAILFNKRFVALGNAKRGMSRFTSLLRMFGLEDRLITPDDLLAIESLDIDPDWGHVNDVLARERAKALVFLKNALEPRSKSDA